MVQYNGDTSESTSPAVAILLLYSTKDEFLRCRRKGSETSGCRYAHLALYPDEQDEDPAITVDDEEWYLFSLDLRDAILRRQPKSIYPLGLADLLAQIPWMYMVVTEAEHWLFWSCWLPGMTFMWYFFCQIRRVSHRNIVEIVGTTEFEGYTMPYTPNHWSNLLPYIGRFIEFRSSQVPE